MEWSLPCYWAGVLSASAGQTTLWGWPRPSPTEPAAHNECAEPTALDLELIRVVYEVLVERVDCAVCGAQLHRAVNVELTQPSFATAQILVATHCRGWRRHRYVATVAERAGELRFGQLGPTDRTRPRELWTATPASLRPRVLEPCRWTARRLMTLCSGSGRPVDRRRHPLRLERASLPTW
jgi:hypothetical protein